MSTSVPRKDQRIQLESLLHLGKECLTNRRLFIFKLSFLFLFLPRMVSLIVLARGANAYVSALKGQGFGQRDLIEGWEGLVSHNLQFGFGINFCAYIFTIIGTLALARISLDYFESKPSGFSQSLRSAVVVFLRKGVGAFLMVLVLLIPASALAILKVILLCLLVNLPLVLVGWHRGGIRSVFDTIFLKFVHGNSNKKWSIFSNMMTIGGIGLSLMFITQMLLSSFADFDLIYPNFFFWTSKTYSVLGGKISLGHLIGHTLELATDSLVIALVMPFAAAIYFKAQEE